MKLFIGSVSFFNLVLLLIYYVYTISLCRFDYTFIYPNVFSRSDFLLCFSHSVEVDEPNCEVDEPNCSPFLHGCETTPFAAPEEHESIAAIDLI